MDPMGGQMLYTRVLHTTFITLTTHILAPPLHLFHTTQNLPLVPQCCRKDISSVAVLVFTKGKAVLKHYTV